MDPIQESRKLKLPFVDVWNIHEQCFLALAVRHL
jgi:hypothetical protein